LLDDYLAHDLTGEERARFVAHLADCRDCSRAVREQERLDALLAEAAERLEPVPAGLTERVGRRLRAARRRRFAAAALALVIGTIWLLNHTAPRPGEPKAPLASRRPEPEAPRPAEHARVTFPAGANVIAVPQPTDSPNVTFLWVYPGLRVAHRPAPAPDNLPPSAERSDQ
jgi:anti-sigma factor RsiW